MPLRTFSDLLDHALAYLGGNGDRGASTQARRAVVAAYQQMPAMHNWSFLRGLGRLITYPSFTTGQVTYDHTGGAVERQLTLQNGTWPAYAGGGVVQIADIPYEVQTRVSDTVLQLKATSNPGVDITSPAAFTLYVDTYPVTTDFMAIFNIAVNSVLDSIVYRHPSEWVAYRRQNIGPGLPRSFGFTGGGSPQVPKEFRLWPPPDGQYTLDFLYKRRPRPLVFDRVEAGTVTASGAAVTGSQTRFTSAMVGSVFRIAGANPAAPVSGWDGENPPAEEATILAVPSATSLTLDASLVGTYSGVRYLVSDPVDFEESIMGRYLFREVEMQCRLMTRMEETLREREMYTTELQRAREADNLFLGRQVAGAEYFARLPLREMNPGSVFSMQVQ